MCSRPNCEYLYNFFVLTPEGLGKHREKVGKVDYRAQAPGLMSASYVTGQSYYVTFGGGPPTAVDNLSMTYVLPTGLLLSPLNVMMTVL